MMVKDHGKPYVFIDSGRPYLVFRGWLHYWNKGGKNWVTLKAVTPLEASLNRPRAIPEEQAALYGFPFDS